MSVTVHDMVAIRHDMAKAGYPDDLIRLTIRARIAAGKAKPARPTVVKVRAARAPKPDAPVGPQARIDRTMVGGYRMVAGFCGMCADVHPAGEHTL